MISLRRYGSLAAIALAVALLLPLAARAEDGVPAVPYTQVPELKAHIERGVSNPKPNDATVAKVDLNQPPDGIPEYIVSYHSTLNCGSGGCATEVLRVSPSGKIDNIAETLGYGVGIAYTATKGMLDILTVRKDGKYTLKFDGRNYQPYQGQSKAATTKPKNWKAPKVFATSDPVATPAEWAASKNAARARGILVWDPVEGFPDVKEYLEAQYDGINLGNTTVAVVELSNPPDSTPEYLVSLDEDSFCGTGGCTLEVLRKRSDGKIESLIAILNFGYSLAYTYTNGMRDILSVSRSGEFIWRFDGKQYKPQKGQPKAATTKPADWKEPLVAGAGPKIHAAAEPKSTGKSQPRPVYKHYSAFPELRSYVEEQAKSHSTEKVKAMKVDLNDPPDGTSEYILYLDTKLRCGPLGCNTQVIRLEPPGEVAELAAFVGSLVDLAATSTSGMRDLLLSRRDVRTIYRFDGKRWIASGMPPPQSIYRKQVTANTTPTKTSSNTATGIPTELKDWWPWRKAEAILPYLEKKNRVSPLGGTRVAMVDLSRPPNGKPNYIIEYDGPGYCKSEGCLREVIGFHFNDPPEAIAEVLGTGFRLGTTSTHDMADLVAETAHGDVIWSFDGQRYVKVLDPRPENLGGTGGKRIELARKPPRQHKPYTGVFPRAPGCVGQYGWRRSYERGRVRRGYAIFGHCTDPENMIVRFSCRSDQRGVEADLQIDPEKAGPVKVVIQVDKAGYLVEANTQYVEMFDYNVPTFRLSPRSPLLNALARGQKASFIVGKKRVKIHLKGAAKAIATMRRACRG